MENNSKTCFGRTQELLSTNPQRLEIPQYESKNVQKLVLGQTQKNFIISNYLPIYL